MSLAENIKRYRTDRKMSQEDLAEALNISRQSVSKWETGKAKPDTGNLIQMAQLFGVSLGELTETQEENFQRPRKKSRKRVVIGILIGILLIILFAAALVVHRYPQVLDRIRQEYHMGQNKKTVKLKHDNIYEDGIDGLLEDLGKVIDFPQHMMLKNSFNLHFAPDGTISSIDTMWYGYDERYTYVDSYLISYDRSKSVYISVWFGGGTGDVYDVEKDVNVLFEALRVIPVEDAVKDWEEPEYGILYKGVRDWGYNTEGIYYIDKEKHIDIPSEVVYQEIKGPTVSVFCPKDESITPKRYIYCERTSEEENVR